MGGGWGGVGLGGEGGVWDGHSVQLALCVNKVGKRSASMYGYNQKGRYHWAMSLCSVLWHQSTGMNCQMMSERLNFH